jgi:outer membrane lipoprotein-sorting protein
MAGAIGSSAKAAEEIKAEKLTAKEILDKTDAQNDAKDQFSIMKMTLFDKSDKKKARKRVLLTQAWNKRNEKRLIKFLSPADVKGFGFLVLEPDSPSEKMYLYLPAFKKIRRIAGSAKSRSFMGSDFSYDDIGSSSYSGDYEAKRMKDEDHEYVLELNKKKKSETDYDRLILWVSREVFVPTKVEFYKIKEKNKYELIKIMRVEETKYIKKYWIPTRIVMENVKEKHTTILEFDQIKLDSGLSDGIFTKRYLQR